ncbi:winged helix-turn-helix domain-containing protein [Phaeovibrio sulfidiphilus]|uniref:Winged helix-turn-helix domain-containing protein n=1 Tax=Phaeovibrio sulfidiphilus TaxID=1220600 RepID=A0A8J7CP35_9PROT|nr:helix-turn-helix domain-containing protein [Phaeovibrio sulfidiphilus]MBE1236572.1 winged helix-turn-helix domain-containing protein [Phaeovibrio sulfidiphilus]
MPSPTPLLVVSRSKPVADVLCSTLGALDRPLRIEAAETTRDATQNGDLARFRAIVLYCGREAPDDQPGDILATGYGGTLVCLDDRPEAEHPAQVRHLPLPVSLAALESSLFAPPTAPEEATALPLAGGRFLFNAKSGVIYRANGEAGPPLTEKETALLLCLYNSASHSARRDDLLSAVWGYGNEIETHTLETYIYRLRQKFPLREGETAPLLTRAGGYALEA